MHRIASLCTRRPWWTLLAVAFVAVVTNIAAAAVGEQLHPYSAADPRSESSRAGERVHGEILIDPDAGIVALVETDVPVRSERGRARVDAVADEVFLDPAVAWVLTPFSTGDESMISKDGRAAIVVGQFGTTDMRDQQAAADRLRATFADDPTVRLGGEAPGNAEVARVVRQDIRRHQLIVFPLLGLFLFWFFRGLVAALLPLATAGIAGAIGIATLRLVNTVEPVSMFTLNLVFGLGLGLAVDYSLLLVSRHREELAAGASVPVSVERTLASAGRTVLFGSIAVAAALSSLLLFPQPYLRSMGIGGIVVALTTGGVALVALPAALVLLGPRIDALAPARLQRVGARGARPERAGPWYRVAGHVLRRPVVTALVAGGVLLLLGLPFLRAEFAPVDLRVLPRGSETREVRNDLDTEFPANLSLPVFAVLGAPRGPAADRFAEELRDLPGAAFVDDPFGVGNATSLVLVSPVAGPLDAVSEDLVAGIRAAPAPFEVLVGGRSAEFVDQKASIAAHLPRVLLVLCGTTFLVLATVLRAPVLALKAVLMNLLTLSAVFGALVFVFQDGRLEGLLDYESTGAIELSQPLLLVAVGFALATDYGLFVLARIKEAHDAGAPDDEAVRIGLERAGRVITACAVVMAVALLVFSSSRIVFIKELGLGLALAVLLDATVVRAVLVPALMGLLGRWNWWMPASLRRSADGVRVAR